VKPVRLWILIADGGRARVLLSAGPGHGLVPVAGMVFDAELPMSHDIGSDRPGRSHESHGPARHAIEPHSDPHQQLKQKFVASVIDVVERKYTSGDFDKLAVVAPPPTLGLIRPLLSEGLKGVIVAEIDKDLTKVANIDVAGHISDLVRI
jgi:protein required for attachment to host cells